WSLRQFARLKSYVIVIKSAVGNHGAILLVRRHFSMLDRVDYLRDFEHFLAVIFYQLTAAKGH
ncbi:MAG: hypothetical protein M3247_04920, partial [Thermoproteota archaeon]|nr:hypothetical protein [Thermoproteota archaeon]